MLVNSTKLKIKINFTDFWHNNDHDAIKTNPLFILLSKQFELILSAEPDFLIYSIFGKNHKKYQCIKIFYTAENIIPNFKECDYAFSFEPTADRNYRLPNYAFAFINQGSHRLKNNAEVIQSITGQKRKFCNFLYSNKNAKTRINFFKQLSAYKPVDSGGKVLNNLGYCVSKLDKKTDFLSQYKFSIAFENESYPGYTTEKIIFPLLAYSIPIYWGNPLIDKDFNSKAFINCHDYDNFDEVIEHIKEVDNDDILYKRYLSEPIFVDNIISQSADEQAIFNRFEQIFTQPVCYKDPVKKSIFTTLTQSLKDRF